MGQAALRPECGALSNACLRSGMDAPMAVGAALGIGIDYDIAGNSGPPLALKASNDDVLDVDGAVVSAKGAGTSALLITTPAGEVVDFIHVWVAQPSALEIVRHNDDGLVIGTVGHSGTLLVGDELLLSVEAFNSTQALLGLFDTEWQIEVLEGDEPLAVIKDLVFGWYRLVARSPGSARLTASALGQSHEIDLEVFP